MTIHGVYRDYDSLESVYEQVGPGWKSLVEKLIIDLDVLGWDHQLLQIKEKFGGLRFYIAQGSDDMWNRVYQAEKESYSICEDCGKPGSLRDRSWMRTLCDECDKKDTFDVDVNRESV